MTTPDAPKTPKRTGPAAGGRPRKTDAERRVKGVTVRLSVERYAELETYAAEGGRTMAHVVRSAVNGKVPQLTPEQEGWLRQLAGMANNLNQLAKKAHQDGFGAVGREVEQRAAELNKILNYFAETV